MSVTYNFEGKVALVTGGASGIGEAIARTFATGKAKVLVADLNAELGEKLVNTIKQAGGDARFAQVDVADPAAVEQMVKTAVQAFGRLDIAVNNAGIGGESNPVGQYSIEGWRKVIDINLNAVFYGMRYQIPQMLSQGGGAIVNMASILGLVGFANAAAYVAAKHGVVGLTQSAALEYSNQGIRVNAVGPGFVQTPLIDKGLDPEAKAYITGLHAIGRLGTPQEIANLVAFLSSEDASFISGSYYIIDGGYTAQ